MNMKNSVILSPRGKAPTVALKVQPAVASCVHHCEFAREAEETGVHGEVGRRMRQCADDEDIVEIVQWKRE